MAPDENRALKSYRNKSHNDSQISLSAPSPAASPAVLPAEAAPEETKVATERVMWRDDRRRKRRRLMGFDWRVLEAVFPYPLSSVSFFTGTGIVGRLIIIGSK